MYPRDNLLSVGHSYKPSGSIPTDSHPLLFLKLWSRGGVSRLVRSETLRVVGYRFVPFFSRLFFSASGFVVFLHRESYLYLFRRTLSRLGCSRYLPAAVAYHALSVAVGRTVVAQFATTVPVAFES